MKKYDIVTALICDEVEGAVEDCPREWTLELILARPPTSVGGRRAASDFDSSCQKLREMLLPGGMMDANSPSESPRKRIKSLRSVGWVCLDICNDHWRPGLEWS